MKKLFENQIIRNLLSAVIFGVVYSVLSFMDNGSVAVGTILKSTVLYFLIICLLYIIAPKLRKMTGHDKDKEA